MGPKLVLLIDRSESMSGGRFFACLRGCADTVSDIIAQGGAEQKQCNIVMFNELVEDVYDGPMSPEAIQALHGIATTTCEGRTRYYDVVTSLIRKGVKQQQPVTFVVATDGYDTASTLCTADTLKQAVDEAKQHAWTFKYIGIAHDTLGANMLRRQATATGFSPEDTYCTDSVLDVPQLVRVASNNTGGISATKPINPVARPLPLPQLARTRTIR